MRKDRAQALTPSPKRVCDFCGKDLALYVVYDTDAKKWCGCEEGKEAGVAERRMAAYTAGQRAWAEKSPTYDPQAPCPKCGNPIRETKYCSGYGWMGYSIYNPQAMAWPYMERTCGRCGYVGYEVPVDAVAVVGTDQ